MEKIAPPTRLTQPTTSRSARGEALRRIKPQQPVVNNQPVRRDFQVVRPQQDTPQQKAKERLLPTPHLLVGTSHNQFLRENMKNRLLLKSLASLPSALLQNQRNIKIDDCSTRDNLEIQLCKLSERISRRASTRMPMR